MFCLPLSCRPCGRRRGALPLFLLMDRLHLWAIHYVGQLSLHAAQHLCDEPQSWISFGSGGGWAAAVSADGAIFSCT